MVRFTTLTTSDGERFELDHAHRVITERPAATRSIKVRRKRSQYAPGGYVVVPV